MCRALALVLLCLTPSALVAAGRPMVGLALGGGGARGMAHVGVLEWLEEHHVPVDFVAGTSMGGLIGGAYATGLSGAELRTLLGEVDWDLMFLGEAPYSLKSFRRKQDARLYPSKLVFGLRKGIGLPSGFDPGHQVNLLLARLTLPYSGLKSFDDLPTPFRCTATDMMTSTLVVFEDGPLAQAMRATMSLPGVFPPVLRGDQVLVDGGVLNNVPADVVRAMGADVVLAVDVGNEPGMTPTAQTIFGLLSQTIDVFMYIATRQVLGTADLVLRPDIKGFSTLDWRKSAVLADLGYQAAAAHASELLPLALDEEAWARHQAKRSARVRRDVAVPTALAVTGVDGKERHWIETQLHRHVGVPLDRERLEQDLTALTGTDRYNSIAYRMLSGPEGEQLGLTVLPKSYGPPFLSLALQIDNTTLTELRFALQGRVTAFDVLGFGSELRLDARIGSPLGLAAELYRPIGGFGLFVAPRAVFAQVQRPVYGETADSLLGESRVKVSGIGLDLGTSFGSQAELRFGYDLSNISTSVFVGAADLPSRDGAESAVYARFEYDGQDAPVVPSRGLRVRVDLRHVFEGPGPEDANDPDGFSAKPTLGELRLSGFTPLGRHRLFANLAGGTAFDTRPIGLYRFTLGGPLRLSALRADELSGRHYLLGSAGYLHSLGRLPDFVGGPVYLGGWVDAGSAFERIDDAELHVHLAGCFLVETLVGPFYLGASVGADKEARIFGGLGVILR